MNQDQLNGMLRILIPCICTWLAAKGFAAFGDTGVVEQMLALALGAVALAWSFIAHSSSSKLKAAAGIDPKLEIQVPASMMRGNEKITEIVNDNVNYPNVTEVKKAA